MKQGTNYRRLHALLSAHTSQWCKYNILKNNSFVGASINTKSTKILVLENFKLYGTYIATPCTNESI